MASMMTEKMKSMEKDLLHLILQFFDENNYRDSLHTLEKESGVFFNMKHLEDMVNYGDLDEAEKYLSGFTNIDDNRYSTKMFFSLRRQKYLEALDRNDVEKAVEILKKDLKVFANKNEGVYKEFASLLSLTNFRENKLLLAYEDTKSAREKLFWELENIIKVNPALQGKLQFPSIKDSMLQTLIDKGLKGENHKFSNLNPDLHTKNLFVDNLWKNNIPRAPCSFTKKIDVLPKGAHEIGATQTQNDVNSNNKRHALKPTEISRPSELCSLRLPDPTLAARIMKLGYTTYGSTLLALSNNAVHKLWKWQPNQSNSTGKASAKVKPLLWTPSSGIHMTNETSESNPEENFPCFVLSENNLYVISTSGGKISLYNLTDFRTIVTFMTPPPTATSMAFHPKDNNVIAIGMDDSTIHIYNVQEDKLIKKLEGHHKRVTGLAFSYVLGILVSSDADSLLCVWGVYAWRIQTSKYLQMPAGGAKNFHTRLQFHKNQSSVLAFHETKLAVYEATELEVMNKWSPRQESMTSTITDASYSSDSESIFVSLNDGRVAVLLSKNLMLRCLINPSAYLPSNPSSTVYPVALAANPSDRNQFALGLTDGGVHILEPLTSDAEWGTLPPEYDAVDAAG